MNDKKLWYVAVDGRRSGPYSQKEIEEQARAGIVGIDAHVFSEGMKDWQVISSRPEFSNAFRAAPPPPPPAPGTHPGESLTAPGAHPTIPVNRFSFARFILVLLLGVAGYFAAVYAATYAYDFWSVYLFPNYHVAAFSGIAGGLLFGLLLFRPFKKRLQGASHTDPGRKGLSLSGWLGVMLGIAGLAAAYFAYQPSQWEAIAIMPNGTISIMNSELKSHTECYTWLTGMKDEYINSRVRQFDCRMKCANKLNCLLLEMRMR